MHASKCVRRNHGRFHIDAARLSQIVGQAYDIQNCACAGRAGLG